MLNIGNQATEFVLYDINRIERSLSEFKSKKVVLAFFPGAFTGVCTKEMCQFRDSLANLNNLNAQVIGISVDSPFANKAFSEVNNLSFPILSDYNREVSNMFCGLYNDFAGLKNYTASKRSVFILDAEGIVRYKWISEDPGKEPLYDEIIKFLETI